MEESIVKQIMPHAPQPWIDALMAIMPEIGVNSPLRQAAFLAQIAHESSGLVHVEENLNYSAQRLVEVFPKYFPTMDIATGYDRQPEKIANKIYGGRMGNGIESSGEGWKYHGRGPIQVTGKSNYFECGEAIKETLIDQPELLLIPDKGMKSAGWYWITKNLNFFADAGDMETITRSINGGLIGFDERMKLYAQASALLGI
jgi:putative chitinase